MHWNELGQRSPAAGLRTPPVRNVTPQLGVKTVLIKVPVPIYHAKMHLQSGARTCKLESGMSEHSTRESVTELLRAHGIAPTRQRTEIAQALFEKRWHPSADEILGVVNERHAEASKATVYNTLKLFLETGLVRELIVDPGRVLYDSNTEVHHHFYDVTSGTVTDIPATGVHIDGFPPLPASTIIAGIDIIVRTRSAS